MVPAAPNSKGQTQRDFWPTLLPKLRNHLLHPAKLRDTKSGWFNLAGFEVVVFSVILRSSEHPSLRHQKRAV